MFASTLFTRAVDPVIPQIAHDLGVDVKTAALLSTAYTFPYAIVQPALGTIGDFFGKTRLMNVSLIIVVTSTLICSVATDFSLLIAMRIVAGMVAGGIFPVGMALIGDLMPVNQSARSRSAACSRSRDRQSHRRHDLRRDRRRVRLARRLLRHRCVRSGCRGDRVFCAARSGDRQARPFNRAAVAAGFQSVFADPRAKVCFGSVFFEGIFIHGLFPYVALLLLASGQTHSSYAGLIIAGFGLGGIVYSLSVSVIVARLTERQVMLTGAAFACIALVLISLNMAWYIQAIVFVVFGFGFYMLHTCIQLHVTELSQTARGAALSMHSCSFYFGQAIGPIYYGFGYSHAGMSAPTLLGAVVIMVIGLVCARLLRHRHHPPGVTAERANGGH